MNKQKHLEADGLQQHKTTVGERLEHAWSDESQFLLRYSDDKVRICDEKC